MVRYLIIGIVVAIAVVIYALVDAAMSNARRVRGVSKPAWLIIILLVPVIGALLWFTLGRPRGPAPTPSKPKDDDPRFTATRLSNDELDAHLEELEARLRELDNETFPGVDETPAVGEDKAGSEDAPDGQLPGEKK